MSSAPETALRALRDTDEFRHTTTEAADQDPDQVAGEPLRRQLPSVLEQAGVQQPLRTDAPRKVVLLPYSSDDRIIVCATNYSGVGPDHLVPEPVSNTGLRISLPAGKRVVGARQTDYPSGEERPLPAQVNEGVVTATFGLGTHKLLVFDLAPAEPIAPN